MAQAMQMAALAVVTALLVRTVSAKEFSVLLPLAAGLLIIGLAAEYVAPILGHYPSATVCVFYNPAKCEKPHSKTDQNDSIPFYDIAHIA